jgi:hypothetical protein
LGEQHLEDLVEAAAFTFHQLQIVEQPCQVFVAAYGGVQHVLRRNAQRQRSGVDHLQPVRMQVQENVTALGVGTMHQCVDQQLAHHDFVESGHVLAVQAIGQFVALAEIGHLLPDRFDQIHRALRVVVPRELVDLLARARRT